MRTDRLRHIAWPLALLTLCLSNFVRGQCKQGTADTFIDVNGIRAAIRNHAGYNPVFLEAPKDSGHEAIFAHALWMGGQVDGHLRLTAAMWGESDYFPGPLTASGDPPADCKAYDRIWVVNAEDLAKLDATGIATDDIRDWPYDLGAEVLDGDGIPNNYDLEAGDRPRVYGDQMAFWVVNDAAGEREFSATEPIGIEVQSLAFAFDDPGYLQTTVFIRNRIMYRGTVPLSDTYLGLWSNLEFGLTRGDYAGADTLLNMAFAYESDNQIDKTWDGIPPALGILMIKTPVVRQDAERRQLGMTNFVETRNTTFDGDGARAGTDDAYRFMRGFWQDGGPVTEGGYGKGGDKPTKIMFPGNPVGRKYWSMENMDGRGTRHNQNGDLRTIQASGPFAMEPGDSQELVYALIWARNFDRFGSITALRVIAAQILQEYESLILPKTGLPPEPDLSFKLEHYPNPASEGITIAYGLPLDAEVSINLFDVLGRQVRTVEDGFRSAGQHPVSLRVDDLPSGHYYYVMTIGNQFVARRKLVVSHR